jgi:hypothetical protein
MARRARGHRYGRVHKEVRRYFANQMARGIVFDCWRCGNPIYGRFDVGHIEQGLGVWLDFKGHLGRWPEHPGCNRATVTHMKQRLALAEGGRSPTVEPSVRTETSREW